MPKSRRRENKVSGTGRARIARVCAAGYRPTRRTLREFIRTLKACSL